MAWSQWGPLWLGAWSSRLWRCFQLVARSKGKVGRGRRGPPPFLHADLRWRVMAAECAQSQKKTHRDTDTGTRLMECACTGVKQNLSKNGLAQNGLAKVGHDRPVGARRVGGPKFRAFFPLPPQNSFFSSLSGGLLVEFWWCLKRRGA